MLKIQICLGRKKPHVSFLIFNSFFQVSIFLQLPKHKFNYSDSHTHTQTHTPDIVKRGHPQIAVSFNFLNKSHLFIISLYIIPDFDFVVNLDSTMDPLFLSEPF